MLGRELSEHTSENHAGRPRRRRRQPAGPLAIADGDTRLTFAQLHAYVRDFAAALVARGLEPGARVAIWSPNTYHWEIAALGVHWAGGVVVPINTRYTGSEAADIVERVNAAALVVVGDFLGADRYAQFCEAAPDLTVPTVVRVPVSGNDTPAQGVLDWDDFLSAATDATAPRPTPAPQPSDRTTSPTSCSPPAPRVRAKAYSALSGRPSESRRRGPSARN